MPEYFIGEAVPSYYDHGRDDTPSILRHAAAGAMIGAAIGLGGASTFMALVTRKYGSKEGALKHIDSVAKDGKVTLTGDIAKSFAEFLKTPVKMPPKPPPDAPREVLDNYGRSMDLAVFLEFKRKKYLEKVGVSEDGFSLPAEDLKSLIKRIPEPVETHIMKKTRRWAIGTAGVHGAVAGAIVGGAVGAAVGAIRKLTHSSSYAPPAIESVVVDLEMRPDHRDPQFTAIWGTVGDRSRKVGQLHNTSLGVTEGLKQAFRDVKYNINERLGLDKNTRVEFGNLTYRFKLPGVIEEKLFEALDRIGFKVCGSIGPDPKFVMESVSPNEPASATQVLSYQEQVKQLGFDVARLLGHMLDGVSFEVLDADDYITLLVRSAEILRDKALARGHDFRSPATVEGLKIMAERPRVRMKLQNIVNALKFQQNDPVALERVATEIAHLILWELNM